MAWFKNLNVRAKLITGFMIVVVLSVVIGVVGIYGINTMDGISDAMYRDKAFPLGDLSSATELFQRQRVQSRNAIIYTGDLESLKEVESDLNHRFAQFEAAMQAYKPTLATEESERIYNAAGSNYYDVFKPGVLEVLEGAKRGVDSVTLLEEMNRTTIAANEIADNLAHLVQIRMDVMSSANEDGSSTGNMLLVMIIIVMLVAAFISILLALYISSMISKPLTALAGFMKNAGTTGDITMTQRNKEEIVEFSKAKDEIGSTIEATASFLQHITNISGELENVANGDLTTEIDLLSDKDKMGLSLKQMIESLNQMFGDINSSTAQVASGSKQIADGAQALAQGSTEQAASVQQLSASISEIAQNTKTNADMANKAASLASTIKHNAEKGSRQMDEMISAVKDINQASQSIQKVIKVIDDIAFQTNILALNAAVEAARAGQHGKGFAVVAEEVRNLAAKSAEAAKDTGGLIADSMEKAELGSRIAGETAVSLAEIVSGINESNQLVSDIASSSEQQSAGITQINSGIDQVAHVVQQNSATAEESAAASEEMSGQSAMLEELIGQFKLKDSGRRMHSRSTPKKQLVMPEKASFSPDAGANDFGKY